MKSMVAGTVSARARSAMKTAAPLRTPVRGARADPRGGRGGPGGDGARALQLVQALRDREHRVERVPLRGQPLAPALLAVDEDHEGLDHEARLPPRLGRTH